MVSKRTESNFEMIKVEREPDGIAFVVLNRPEKRNAMSPQLHREMCEALDELETEEATKIVVITGAGEAFSAGQDIKPRGARGHGMIRITGAGRSCRNSPSPPSRW